jgi:hypothetical protein
LRAIAIVESAPQMQRGGGLRQTSGDYSKSDKPIRSTSLLDEDALLRCRAETHRKIIIRNDLYAVSEVSKAASALDKRLEVSLRRSNLPNVTDGLRI